MKLQIAELKPTLDVFSAVGGKKRGSDEWNADLAPVRVSAQHESHCLTLGSSQQIIGIVGAVAKENDGLERQVANGFGNRSLRIRVTFKRIFETSQPESAAAAFNGQITVVDHRDAVISERRGDFALAHKDVVVAKAGIALRAFELIEDGGALPRGVFVNAPGDERTGDEITRQKDDIGIELVDVVDGNMEKKRFSELVEVDVTELCDAKSVKGSVKAGDGDFATGDFDPMTLNFA